MMMTAKSLSSKHPVLKINVALFFFLKLYSSHIYYIFNSFANFYYFSKTLLFFQQASDVRVQADESHGRATNISIGVEELDGSLGGVENRLSNAEAAAEKDRADVELVSSWQLFFNFKCPKYL